MFGMSTMKKLSDFKSSKGQAKAKAKPAKLAHPDGRRRSSLMKKSWFSRHRTWLMIIAGAIVAGATVTLLALYFLSGKQAKTNLIPSPQAEPVHYYSPLTGRETTKQKTSAPVLAVMIENSPEARPQSGLTEAGVVFEAVAEGGITRFIALYQETEPSLIGPVRSIRPYYLEWAAAFDAGIAHVGGSDEAIEMVRSGAYGVDLDQFSNGSSYWRSKDRLSPHNVYTDYANLDKLIKEKGKSSSKFSGFSRKKQTDDTAAAKTDDSSEQKANIIKLAVSSSQYEVAYQYDKEAKTYQRSLGGKPHYSRAIDGTDSQLSPAVVIAMRVNQTLAADRLHNQIATNAGGEVFVFQNGKVVKGNWSKERPTSQIRFVDANGQEIQLIAGQTWITAMPNGKAIDYE
jgi:hypothetical protein